MSSCAASYSTFCLRVWCASVTSGFSLIADAPNATLCRSLLGSLLALAPQSAQQLCPLFGAMVLIERLTAYQLDLRSTLSLSKQPGRSFDSS